MWSACALDLMVLLSQTKQGKRQWRKRQRIAEDRAAAGAVAGASVVKEESESEEAGLETSEQAVQARPETTEQAVQTDVSMLASAGVLRATPKPTPKPSPKPKASPARPPRLVKEVFIATLGEDQELGNALWVDCKLLRDPRCFNLRQHPGLHPVIVDSAAQHRALPGMLAEIKQYVSQESFPCIELVCKSGKHRSVAMSVLLSHVLTLSGHRVHVEHRNSSAWGPGQRCLEDRCSACLGVAQKLNDVWELWQSL